jgi:Transposase DDE domain
VAQRRHIRAYIATGRQRHRQASATHDRQSRRPLIVAMRRRLRRSGWRSRYRLRKHTVEPVFGITKHARGFRRFLLRGTTHNLRKLAVVRT